eukprot:1194565-Prorocentrum_minimum.AAC.1
MREAAAGEDMPYRQQSCSLPCSMFRSGSTLKHACPSSPSEHVGGEPNSPVAEWLLQQGLHVCAEWVNVLAAVMRQDSLGGNTKTVMCANIGPADYNFDETMSTLRYANRAKNIKNKPRINEDPKDAMLREFQEEIARLKAQ